MRKEVALAALGLLIGAAAIAGGGGDDDLREQLRKLQEAAAKVMAKDWEVRRLPPSNDMGQELRLYPVYDLTCGVPDYIPPARGIYLSQDEEAPFFGGVAEEWPQRFGTIEELMELVRFSVQPRAWETGTIVAQGQTLVVMQKPAVAREIGQYLDGKLRPRAHRCVMVEADLVEVTPSLHRTLTGGAVDQEALRRALDGGAARRVRSVRATGLLGQRFVAWHGRQVAVASDRDVEVAQDASTSDPVVDIVQAGASLAVRPSAGGDGKRITLALDVAFRDLVSIGRHETRENGVIDMPRVEDQGYATSVTVANRTWTAVGSGVSRGEKMRVLLVRATLLERGGGAR